MLVVMELFLMVVAYRTPSYYSEVIPEALRQHTGRIVNLSRFIYIQTLPDGYVFIFCLLGCFLLSQRISGMSLLDANLLIQLKNMYAIAYLLALSATQASPTASLKIS
jgi:hypothetical protein